MDTNGAPPLSLLLSGSSLGSPPLSLLPNLPTSPQKGAAPQPITLAGEIKFSGRTIIFLEAIREYLDHRHSAQLAQLFPSASACGWVYAADIVSVATQLRLSLSYRDAFKVINELIVAGGNSSGGGKAFLFSVLDGILRMDFASCRHGK
jgi:hypothetical protein